MKHDSTQGTGFVAGGTLTGASLSAVLGKMGLVGKFGGVSIGMMPVAVVGGVSGAAAYGAFKAIEEGDIRAIGAIGLGTAGGMGVSSVIGGMGLGFTGTAVGIGMMPLSIAGGVVGLGMYGLAKMFFSSQTQESFTNVYERMESKIYEQEAYYQALIDLDPTLQELEWSRKIAELEIEEELKHLKITVENTPHTATETQDFLVVLLLQSSSNKHQDLPSESQYNQLELEEILTQLKQQLNQEYNLNPIKEGIDKLINALEDHHQLTVTKSPTWQCGLILSDHNADVNAVSISPDGQTLASGSDDKTVKLWDLSTGKHLYTFFGCSAEVRTVAFSPAGEMLISGGFDQRISAWYLSTKKLFPAFFSRNSYHSHEGLISSLVCTPDGRYIISAGSDRTLKLWDRVSGTWQRNLNGHTDHIGSIAISGNGQTLVSGSGDKTIRVWDLSTYKTHHILQGHQGEITAVTISPDGKLIVSGSTDTTVKLWDVYRGELIETLTGHKRPVLSITISSDGETLVTASSQEVKIWHLKTGQLMQNLSGCNPVLFSPQGNFFISGSQGKYLKVWYPNFSNNFAHPLKEFNRSGEWWEVLEISRTATPKEVKEAYRNLARKYHPDLNPDEQSMEIMQIINIAYEQFLKSMLK